MELPTHCLWCGVVLRGGATQHTSDCWLSVFNHKNGLRYIVLNTPLTDAEVDAILADPVIGDPARVARMRRLAAATGECTCRTSGCGHRASSHIGGHCFECGKEGCWS